MSINLDQAQQTFLVEARELLQAMEESLLQLESEPGDQDAIGAVFRAAHTIKGSAGLFGLTPIVSFTHIVEDVLDRLREGSVSVDAGLIAVLLKSGDHMLELIDVVASRGQTLQPPALGREAALRQALQVYQAPGNAQPADEAQAPSVIDEQPAEVLWHISLRFGVDVFRNGMDPLSFLRYLNTLGQMVQVTTVTDSIPALEAWDPESCHLGFEIDFRSSAGHAAINEVFDFVREDCAVEITPVNETPDHVEPTGTELVSQTEHSPAVASGELLGDQRAVPRTPATATAKATATAVERPSSASEQKNKDGRYVRVNADKLDELINLVGELVIASAGASLLAKSCDNDPLQEASSTVSGLVEQILDGALHLRMIPIGDTFNRFRRVVRDVSQELGKDIDLIINGAETELDKTVVEKIGDPLMHLLRNSMDHGIESAEARRAAGKPAKGHLSLNAYHDSGSIVIEIADDGAGLNRERILDKAQQRGLVAAGASLTDQEIYNLIFEPGFSTAEAVTNLSGRGVCMDVVKRNITLLRGTVDLDSQPGQGTIVRIRLPLTLAIINGFLVGIDQSTYVIPLDMVQECIELDEHNRQLTRDSGYLDLRGEVLPLVYLRDHFNHEGPAARRQNVVVVRYAEHKAGLVVDDLLGEFQTVIKPLGKLFGALRGISGSTILGSGAVALILDIPALLNQIVQMEARSTQAPQSLLPTSR
ncbi:chemotaxis protein CheA [Pseudomonas savastanoi]|uniref:Chemotaxis protein CheA n=1 Tax=Pseudomonas savastanoi pv. glycinea TaxID=318 RepID=A0AB74AVR5_PSESG|nr:chemotaxis protein CheA [Pseudomonas savastanoi]EFW82100.1 chemotaxis sensor histidine kinase CheA [Pseudomonas savastanoi pv. glycinea str. B076]KPC24311.1 Chemotaxis sensor histidine kinase CheA [Pseudomonas savastanoi pv. glycinea]KPC30102.1 Chemotaxis sensor histidine kinase CheA [Pseudomonas savastanoi pv. glycinea]KPC42903.1 Chemotaxis sensor histidine kinase CheA [Pseudomonas savastanoi pv. glycinea]KPC46388.1 Chemotaxis sensor histidine kinase CheA [Pseudomonas savastanoi pv. glycin